ncbi:MAG: hypothetical protein ACOC8F_07965 [Planctomycetota bacterium]
MSPQTSNMTDVTAENPSPADAAVPQDRPGAPSGGTGSGDSVARAVEELRQAVAGRQRQDIARAYEELRRAAHGMKVGQLLQAVRGALGEGALSGIVGAYAHRPCYMCSGGVVVCDQCKGRGELEPGRACANCDGLGLLGCGFCGGTGWADLETVSTELREAVVLRQASHVRRGVTKLVKTLSTLTRPRAREMALKQRVDLIARILRTQARLSSLAEADALDAETRARMSSAAEKLEDPLAMLRGGMRPSERAQSAGDGEASDSDAA